MKLQIHCHFKRSSYFPVCHELVGCWFWAFLWSEGWGGVFNINRDYASIGACSIQGYTCLYILNLGLKLADITLMARHYGASKTTFHFIFISNSSIVTLYFYHTSLSFFLKKVYYSNNFLEINFIFFFKLKICYTCTCISVCFKFNFVIKRKITVKN